ncbi:hypothetical protein CANCADRAFT_11340, partial [Tortispora caseinolytica NRRL Y-17796]
TEEQKAEAARARELKALNPPVKSDPILAQCVNLLMKDGKKAQAERILARTLYLLHLKSRKDPVHVLKEALDLLAPLTKVRKKRVTGAKSVDMPVPLNERQRIRQAFVWMRDASAGFASRDIAVRLSEEIWNTYNGTSSSFARREAIYKSA